VAARASLGALVDIVAQVDNIVVVIFSGGVSVRVEVPVGCWAQSEKRGST